MNRTTEVNDISVCSTVVLVVITVSIARSANCGILICKRGVGNAARVPGYRKTLGCKVSKTNRSQHCQCPMLTCAASVTNTVGL